MLEREISDFTDSDDLPALLIELALLTELAHLIKRIRRSKPSVG